MLNVIYGKTPCCKITRAHLPYHTPPKSGDRAWMIVDEETNEVVDRYTPLPQPKLSAWALLNIERRGH